MNNEDIWRQQAMSSLSFPINTPWYMLKDSAVYFIYDNATHQDVSIHVQSTNSANSWLKPANIGFKCDPSKITIVKIWQADKRMLYEDELKSSYLLSNIIGNNSFGKYLRIPQILFNYEHPDKSFTMIGYSYEGTSVLYEILNYKSDNCARMHRIGYLIGYVLRGLHESNAIKTWDVTDLPINAKYLKVREWGQKYMVDTLQQFEINKPSLGYVQGDTNLGNYLVPLHPLSSNDDDIKNLVMIDYSGISENGTLGLPCYEYHQFISSILLQLRSRPPAELMIYNAVGNHSLNNLITDYQNLSDALFKGFMSSYPLSCFSAATHQLMYSYWNNRRSTFK